MASHQHDESVASGTVQRLKPAVARRETTAWPQALTTAGSRLDSMLVLRLQASAGNQAVGRLLSPRHLTVQRDPPNAPTQSLDERYRAVLQTAKESGDFRNAAELLNGFNRADILSRLAELSDEQISYMHLGAAGNPAVGPDSQVAELTRPGAPRASTVGPNSSRAPSQSPPPTQQPVIPDTTIANMTATEKLVEAFHRADINAAVREKILSVMTPEALAAAIIAFAVVFVASQFTPVGWAADIALGFTAIFIGAALFRAANHLINFAAARNATTSQQLDAAGREFARAVAEIEVDAILFLIMRTAGGGPRGGTTYNGPPGGEVLLATSQGQLVVVAAETAPVEVAGQLGITGGATAMSMSGGPRDNDYWEDKYGDDSRNELPRRQRISDGNKQELEDSGWLKQRLPNDERRREFMNWLERGHDQGETHTHLRPGSREAEAAVREFESESP